MDEFIASSPFTPRLQNPRTLLKRKFEQKQLEELTNTEEATVNGIFDDLYSYDEPEINREKFQELMVEAGHGVYSEDAFIEGFWNGLDINHDASVDLKELVVGLTVLLGGTFDQKLRLGYRTFDLDGDGFIQRGGYYCLSY
eukprot:TRINITY_DN6130_c0_g1_i1.p1 TRINITY_DN6130_c0_g1~~TRINITY_DN6130_c0_g1_i1.p1  ORF type:complete len:141 (-),score=40.73 TRINITY_DN6130_c0_g1_i1:32-454(-)